MNEEKTLILRSQQHDFEAFSKLVSLYENMVFNLAYRLLNNAEDAEDVLQETFLNAFKSIKNFRSEAKFSTWLYRIAYNLCLAKLKYRPKHNYNSIDIQDGVFEKIQVNTNHLHDWSVSPEDNLLTKELSAILEKAILDLPQQNRAVFVLRDVEGYTTQEVSDITSLSVSAVKSRLHRARLMLRGQLSEALKARVS